MGKKSIPPKVRQTGSLQDDEKALERRFLVRAQALSKLPEAFRCVEVALLMNDAVAFNVRAEAEIFQAVYGDPSGREYWDAHFSEPVPASQLATVLSIHLAVQLAYTVEQMEYAKVAILRAFQVAAETSEPWLMRDTARLPDVKAHPRAAVEWLMRKPKHKHLVGDSVRRYLKGAKRPGRPSKKGVRIAEEMRAMIKDGEEARLRAMPYKEMQGEFGAAPSTCASVREKVLEENRELSA